MRLIARQGYTKTTLAAVGKEAGYTGGLVSHHFGSKEKLYGEVLQQIADELLAALIQATSDNADAEAQLEQLFERLHENRKTHPEQTQLLMRELLDEHVTWEQAHGAALAHGDAVEVDVAQGRPTQELRGHVVAEHLEEGVRDHGVRG